MNKVYNPLRCCRSKGEEIQRPWEACLQGGVEDRYTIHQGLLDSPRDHWVPTFGHTVAPVYRKRSDLQILNQKDSRNVSLKSGVWASSPFLLVWSWPRVAKVLITWLLPSSLGLCNMISKLAAWIRILLNSQPKPRVLLSWNTAQWWGSSQESIISISLLKTLLVNTYWASIIIL